MLLSSDVCVCVCVCVCVFLSVGGDGHSSQSLVSAQSSG